MDASTTPSKTQQTNYCFPMLKNSVILQCMSELGFDMNEKELLEPHKYKDRVRFIFRELVSPNFYKFFIFMIFSNLLF